MFSGLRSAWRGLRRPEVEQQEEREDLERKAARVETYKALLSSPGWKNYSEILRARHETLLRELETGKVETLPALQAQARELRTALELAPALLADAERARLQLQAWENAE